MSFSTLRRNLPPPVDKPYIMVHGEPLVVDEKYKESGFLSRFFSYKGEIPVTIKTPILVMALHFCVKRVITKDADKNHSFIWDMGLGFEIWHAFELLHAASSLDIKSLYDQLFPTVVYIFDEMTADEIKSVVKVRYRDDDPDRLFWMNYVLDCAPKEEMKFDREEILKVAPDGFNGLQPYPKKHYWVYAHLVIKRNLVVFIMAKQLKEEEKEELGDFIWAKQLKEEKHKRWLPSPIFDALMADILEVDKTCGISDRPTEEEKSKQEAAAEEEEEDSKVPKNDDDVGGSVP